MRIDAECSRGRIPYKGRARASLYTGGDECHPVKIYPFQQFEISSCEGSRRYLRLSTTRARRSKSGRRISNIKLSCSRRDTMIKTKRIVRRINMSTLDRSSTSFIVAVSDVETGINDTMLLLLIRQEANKWKMKMEFINAATIKIKSSRIW